MNALTALKIIFITITFQRVDGNKVLLLGHLQGSHLNMVHAIGQELVKRHHDVYSVLPKFSRHIASTQNKGIKILTSEADKNTMLMESDSFNDLVNQKVFEEKPAGMDIKVVAADVCEMHCDLMMHDKTLLETIQKHNFDLAILDAFFLNNCLFVLPHYLNIPYVALSETLSVWTMGIPTLPSFIAHFGQKRDFWQKLQLARELYYWTSDSNVFNQNKKLLKEFAPTKNSWMDLVKDSVLFVYPRDYILDSPVPTMPNVIFTPAFLYGPAKPVPQKLLEKIPKSKPWVIVSFGSTGGAMPSTYFEKFADAFSQLKDYFIIWKLPNSGNHTFPPNVMALSWLPQNDLLGHAQTRAFVTHCGANGIHEALYHGIPMVGFPLFAEQPENAAIIENRNYGLSLDIKTFTSSDLVLAIKQVISSETINNEVSRMSHILKERQLPREEVAYWIEHVMKYGGEHLRSVSIDMPLYELFCFDVIAILLIVLFAILLMAFCVVRCICRVLRKQSNKVKYD